MSRASWVLFGPAALWMLASVVGLGATLTDAEAWAPVDRGSASVVGSRDCRRCHPHQHRTWHRSYHRTMTQDASAPGAVLAPFAGETLRVAGFVATMDRDQAGHPRIRVTREGAAILEAAVDLTVGSHRYQQYVARIDRGGGELERYRLPVAWHIGEQRWIHMGGAFLVPDTAPGDEDAYLRFVSRWNDNCIFCHNTEPAPGLQPDGTLATTVGEIGIGCEACHGKAGDHVARHESLSRRLLAAALPRADGSIANPGRMNPARQSDVCGRCHGQRIGSDITSVLRDGDGFVPGHDLGSVSRPIFGDSRLRGEQPFGPRFWPDGTPRLSAYEYQGLLLSPCYADGDGMGCEDCHAMHGEDPNLQLNAAFDRTATCQRCHSLPAEHGGHESVDCVDCHMPQVTYGLLQSMISHRITSPDPGRLVGRSDEPDACTQCHVESSRSWAAGAMRELALAGTEPAPAADEEAWASRVELDLVGGDPIQRVLAAYALGEPGPGPSDQRKQMLVLGLQDDYPVVRWASWRALRSLGVELPGFDYTADAAQRVPIVDRLAADLGAAPIEAHPERLQVLYDRRSDAAIEIGE